jgi:hypothetical protein
VDRCEVVTFKRKRRSGSFGVVRVKKGVAILDCGSVMTLNERLLDRARSTSPFKVRLFSSRRGHSRL